MQPLHFLVASDVVECGMGTLPNATVDLVADIICPWCLIGRRTLDTALAALTAEGQQLDWVWRPFLLYPDAPPGGFQQEAHLRHRFGSAAVADRYHAGVVEAGRIVGFEFRYDLITCTPNTTDAHRLLLFSSRSGRQAHLADKLAQAFFTDGLDIGDRDVLAGLAGTSGIDADAARTMLDGERYQADVTASDAMAKRAGIRSVPNFCLHGRILNVPEIVDLASELRAAHFALAR
jgi:predicted DsbA family dithiol-disulfide isomerase